MKKVLTITLISGRIITRDLTLMNIGAPIGAPANDASYAILCRDIGMTGYTDPDLVTEMKYTHIAPSQIATVTVKFEK